MAVVSSCREMFG